MYYKLMWIWFLFQALTKDDLVSAPSQKAAAIIADIVAKEEQRKGGNKPIL